MEADVFLIDGRLRVGHDRNQASRAGTLEAVYLQPLASLAARCGQLTESGAPFLLLLEVKEASHPAYEALVAMLQGHEHWIALDGVHRDRPVEVVMVGWTPAEDDARVMRQRRIANRGDTLAGPGVRLLSMDYGKTMGRRWRTAAGRRKWVSTLRAARRANPHCLLRVHNVPVEARIYKELLAAGVDLVGTRNLAATRGVLEGLRR